MHRAETKEGYTVLSSDTPYIFQVQSVSLHKYIIRLLLFFLYFNFLFNIIYFIST